MFIAQHSVAGEGDVRPLPEPSPDASADADALAEFICDTTNLPWIIFRAAHRANHVSGLATRARALLAALARTVDADRPYAAIFARRELLTGRAMQSMRTFYRALDDLETVGLIVRAPQKRYGEAGLFGRAYLHLSEKAAQLLGLVTVESPEPDQSASRIDPQAAPTSLEQPSARVADGAIYKDLSPQPFQKRQPGQLPADLQRLRSLGFREFLIFRLMREAREHGKFLSDVVDVTWQHLKQAHAPINYLRALLRSTADFSHQVRTKKEAVHQAERQQQEAIQVQNALASCAGQVFFDQSGERRIEIGDDAASMTVHDWREAAPRVAAGHWQGGFVNALLAGNVRRANPRDEEAFVARRQKRLKPPVASGERSLLAPDATLAAQLAQLKLKQLLKGARAGRPLAQVSGRS